MKNRRTLPMGLFIRRSVISPRVENFWHSLAFLSFFTALFISAASCIPSLALATLSAQQPETATPRDNAPVLPSQAMRMLYDALPLDVTLGTASNNTLLDALSSLMFTREEDGISYDFMEARSPSAIFVEAATLVAIARPALIPDIEDQVEKFYPESASDVGRALRQALENPTPDQLSAIATREGLTPAAGQDENGSEN